MDEGMPAVGDDSTGARRGPSVISGRFPGVDLATAAP